MTFKRLWQDSVISSAVNPSPGSVTDTGELSPPPLACVTQFVRTITTTLYNPCLTFLQSRLFLEPLKVHSFVWQLVYLDRSCQNVIMDAHPHQKQLGNCRIKVCSPCSAKSNDISQSDGRFDSSYDWRELLTCLASIGNTRNTLQRKWNQ